MTRLTPPKGWQAPYKGIAWQWRAEDASAVDCKGLVRLVWREVAGVNLPDMRPLYDDRAAGSDFERALMTARMIKGHRSAYQKIDTPRPLAIVEIMHQGWPAHLGLYVEGGRILHACQERGSVAEDRIDDFGGFPGTKGSRISGFYWPGPDLLKARL